MSLFLQEGKSEHTMAMAISDDFDLLQGPPSSMITLKRLHDALIEEPAALVCRSLAFEVVDSDIKRNASIRICVSYTVAFLPGGC